MSKDSFYIKASTPVVWLIPLVSLLILATGIAVVLYFTHNEVSQTLHSGHAQSLLSLNATLIISMFCLYLVITGFYFNQVIHRLKRNLHRFDQDSEWTSQSLSVAEQELQQLRQAHEVSRSLVAQLPAALLVFNDEQKIAFINPAAEMLFDVSSDAAQGHTLQKFFELDPNTFSELMTLQQQSLQHQHIIEVKQHLKIKNNRNDNELTRATLIPISNGDDTHFTMLHLSNLNESTNSTDSTHQDLILEQLKIPYCIVKNTAPNFNTVMVSTALAKFKALPTPIKENTPFFNAFGHFNGLEKSQHLAAAISRNRAYLMTLEHIDDPSLNLELQAFPLKKNEKGELLFAVVFSLAKQSDTGIANHLKTHNVLGQLSSPIHLATTFEQAKQTGAWINLLYLSIERPVCFSANTPTQSGELMKGTLKRVNALMRSNDHIFYLGEDNYLIMLSGTDTQQEAIDGAKRVGKHILDSVTQRFIFDNQNLQCQANIGIAQYPDNDTSLTDLIKKAKLALNQVKKVSSNTLNFYDTTQQPNTELRHTLETALDNDELTLYYHPMIDVTDFSVVGVEALLRWENLDNEHFNTAELFNSNDGKAMSLQLDKWSLSHAIAQVNTWESHDLHVNYLIVNIAKASFWDDEFIDEITSMIKQSKETCFELELEIQEETIAEAPQQAIIKLQTLRDSGVNLSISHFGMGASSLNYLDELPINSIKLHPSLMNKLAENEQKTPLIKGLIDITKHLNINLIADGVETKEMLESLKTMNVKYAQGYVFTQPLPGDEIKNVLKKN